MQIPKLQFFLDRSGKIGLQMQLQEAIVSGQFAAGDKLPSTRLLAQHLGIARITVSQAYQSLVADGYLISAARGDYHVFHEAPGQAMAAQPIEPPPSGRAIDWSRRLSGRYLHAEVSEVLITLGAQNALWLIAHLLFDGQAAPAAAIEEPGYAELRELLCLTGVRVVPVPLDEEGIRVDLIPDDVQAVFVMPAITRRPASPCPCVAGTIC